MLTKSRIRLNSKYKHLMKTVKLFRLRSKVTDSGTNTHGMLTHSIHTGDGSLRYAFQPHGLDEETKEPLKRIILDPTRIKGDNIPTEEVELPMEVLGTMVTDTASGFSGMAIQLCRHTHGCVHVLVQSQERTKSGGSVDPCDFNYIQLEGDAIPKMTEEEIKAEQVKKPSPSDLPGGDSRLL